MMAIVGLAVLAGLVARSGVVASFWVRWQAPIAAEIATLEAVRPGAVLLMVSAEPRTPHFVFNAGQRASWMPPLQHVASYAVLHAPVFVPMTFAHPLQQPLAVRSDYRALKAYQANDPIPVQDADALDRTLADIAARITTQWPSESDYQVVVRGLDRIGAWSPPAGIVPGRFEIAGQGPNHLLLTFRAN